ncbi:phasin family protein [Enterovirga sp.]|uniref:phasin family protein n=1 Tax=Enterovirga sp. TaxID=2026350 RepID=UPI0026069F3D|nr:phasin family protein [Enterovirga sp.]MDB5592707.1 phasin [Enterovirga sp.]
MKSDKPDMSVRDVAEKGVEKARDAIDFLLDAARNTAEAVQSSTKTDKEPAGQAVQKGFGFAKENITAVFDLAQKLVRAPDLKQAAQLQADFVKTQAGIITKQVEELRNLSEAREGEEGRPAAGAKAGPGGDAKAGPAGDARRGGAAGAKAGAAKPETPRS